MRHKQHHYQAMASGDRSNAVNLGVIGGERKFTAIEPADNMCASR